MTWLTKLFGGSKKDPLITEIYKELTITATPQLEDGQYRLAGYISNSDGAKAGFVRADLFTNLEQAQNYSIAKAKQIIDERKGDVFDSRI